MKHLKSYKIFEDKDDDNKIPGGFEYSWNDINKSLVYLTDLGFEIDKPERYQWDYEDAAKRRYLADKNGDKIKHTSAAWGQDYKSNVELAKWAIYELRLKKPVTINGIYREGDNPIAYGAKNKFFLTENPENMIEIYQEIDAFCGHFDKSYYSLLTKPDGYYLWLIVASEVSEDYINNRLDKEFNDKVKEKLNTDFYAPFSRFYNQVRSDYTKKFREGVFGGTLGSLEDGYYIKRFDFDKVSKQVINTNKSQFDTDIERFLNYFNKPGYWNLGKYGFKAEYKILTEEDCKILDEDDSKSKERFIGKNVLIVTFNYQDVLKKYKEDKFSEKED